MVKPTVALALGLAGTAVGAPSTHDSVKRADLDQPDPAQGENTFGRPFVYDIAQAGEGTEKRVPPPEILDQLDPDMLGSLRKEVEKAKRQFQSRPPLMPIMPWEEPDITQASQDTTESAEKTKRQFQSRPPLMPIMPWEEPDITQAAGGETENAEKAKRQLTRPPFMAPPPSELVNGELQNIPEATEDGSEKRYWPGAVILADVASGNAEEKREEVADEDVADMIWGNPEKRSMAPSDPEPVEAPSTDEILAAFSGEKKRAVRFSS